MRLREVGVAAVAARVTAGLSSAALAGGEHRHGCEQLPHHRLVAAMLQVDNAPGSDFTWLVSWGPASDGCGLTVEYHPQAGLTALAVIDGIQREVRNGVPVVSLSTGQIAYSF